MASGEKLLTALQITKLKEPGRYADGGGLYLEIDKKGNKRWLLRLQVARKRRDFGLGPLRKVPLAMARELAQEHREIALAGGDPSKERKAKQRAATPPPSFSECAKGFHKENFSSWRNAKHAAQVLSTLETYAFPFFGSLPVDQVTEADARKALLAIWLEKPETARRLRQRISSVTDWAKACGYRDTTLDLRTKALSLPKQPRSDGHHAAMPYKDVPAFLGALQGLEAASDTVRLLLEFVVLTACRLGEARLAVWGEVDFDKRVWVVPGDRMKAGKEHRVPLSDRALEILEAMAARKSNTSDFIFPGMKPRRPVSDMAITMLYRRLEVDATTHGFRSSFRDWVAETRPEDRDAAEAQLAHSLGGKVETAYLRTTLFERRRELVLAWADFLMAEA